MIVLYASVTHVDILEIQWIQSLWNKKITQKVEFDPLIVKAKLEDYKNKPDKQDLKNFVR